VEVLRLLRHPNVVLFVGVCVQPPATPTDPSTPCIVTEYIEGGSLFHLLHARVDPSRAAAGAIGDAVAPSVGVEYTAVEAGGGGDDVTVGGGDDEGGTGGGGGGGTGAVAGGGGGGLTWEDKRRLALHTAYGMAYLHGYVVQCVMCDVRASILRDVRTYTTRTTCDGLM